MPVYDMHKCVVNSAMFAIAITTVGSGNIVNTMYMKNSVSHTPELEL